MRILSDWFNLAKIARSGQCFRWRAVGEGIYEIPAFGRTLVVRQISNDCIEADCGEQDWLLIWSRYFDMDTDYDAYARAVDPSDKYLTAAAAAARGLRMLRQDFWETTASFIVSQNNNIPRISGILNRLCDLCGGFPDPQGVLAIDQDALARCGLGYRLAYIRAAAERFISERPEMFIHNYDYKLSREYLMSIHGVGPKVADCICLYGLGHRDAFPRDVWVRRIENDQYGGKFPQEKYEGYAGVLQLFMFWYERNRDL
ncbi:MAG: 8-oxoguanine DNA glycosylase [Oscillospiraceae bacterium]|jgi:N-glycosylase/DNA lyase|nr:8-oxoguanine DNA glycosylase [Oscillospiraceae bacterium]